MNPQEAKKLEKKLLSTLGEYINKNDTLVAGISGGSDSVFLLNLLKKFQESTPCTIISAHLNHMLRAKDADLDEALVKSYSGPNLIFHSKKVDIKKLSQTSKKGIEETGRDQRYKFFKELAKKHKAKFILTAHHADDNVETMLLNLVRGTGLQGLSGIKESEKIEKNLQLLRPLLTISKKQITDYLKFQKIKYHNDKSNLSNIYRRNSLRNKTIPELQKLNPNLTKTLNRTSQQIRELDQFLKKLAQDWIKQNKLNNSFTRFNSKSLTNKPKALQKIIIRQIHQKLIGDTRNIENIHIEEILTLINKNIGNKKKKLGKTTFSINKGIINISNTD